jgi:hypothetical protein
VEQWLHTGARGRLGADTPSGTRSGGAKCTARWSFSCRGYDVAASSAWVDWSALLRHGHGRGGCDAVAGLLRCVACSTSPLRDYTSPGFFYVLFSDVDFDGCNQLEGAVQRRASLFQVLFSLQSVFAGYGDDYEVGMAK